MFKTDSPYIKELLKCNIEWKPFTRETFEIAIKEDKMLFVHIGNISNTENRNLAYELFHDERVVQMLHEHFICIPVDTEDVPEAYLIGMDLLLINEQKISEHINIFSLPGIKPVTSFSSLYPDDFLQIATNVATAFTHKRQKLETAAEYLTRRLQFSGLVTRKEAPAPIAPKILHAYIRSWSSRFLDKTTKYNRQPYILTARNLSFILEYAHTYQVKEYLNYIDETLTHVYYSPMFDPIEGGIFRQATDYTLKEPTYELSVYENANAMILFTTAYRCFKKRIYKEAAQRIAEFLESSMHISGKGFFTYTTLNVNHSESTYYKYSLKELQENFKQRWESIAIALGMDLKTPSGTMQTISNTPHYWNLTHSETELLLKIRRKRIKELLPDKRVKTGYNCKVATAFCILSQISGNYKYRYLATAAKTIDTVLKNKDIDNLTSDLYDYAHLLNSILNLYLITRESRYLSLAKKYTSYIFSNHYQSSVGMFTKSPVNKGKTPLKRAPVIDYNTLSSNSIMAENMLLMNKVAGNDEIYINTFKQQIYNIEPQLVGSGPFMAGWGTQILRYLTGFTHLPPDEQ